MESTVYRFNDRRAFNSCRCSLIDANIPFTKDITGNENEWVILTYKDDQGNYLTPFRCDKCHCIHFHETTTNPIHANTNMFLCDACYNELPTCSSCGEKAMHLHDTTDGEYTDMCDDCLRKLDDYIECDHCGEFVPTDEMVETKDGEFICDTCIDEYYFYCEECNEYVHEHDMNVIDSIYYVCDDCLENSPDFFQCDHCSEWHHIDNRVTDGSTDICETCYSDYYVICENCGDLVYCDNAIEYEYEYYCESCAPEESEYIHDYGYKPCPVFLGDSDNKRYFGLEIETGEGDVAQFVEQAIDQLSEDETIFYFKSDSSIDENGAELVTNPMGLDYAIGFDWEKLHQIAKDAGQRSHDAGGCGFHIHVSREGLGSNETERELTTARLILMFDRYWSDIVKFSRRQEHSLTWCNRCDSDLTADDDNATMTKKFDDYKQGKGHERYKAINLRNYNTIEFRIFRGTLNPNTIRATVLFVNELIDYCMTTDNENLTSSKPLFEQVPFSAPVLEYAKTRGLV